jgi:hypothetical protein
MYAKPFTKEISNVGNPFNQQVVKVGLQYHLFSTYILCVNETKYHHCIYFNCLAPIKCCIGLSIVIHKLANTLQT